MPAPDLLLGHRLRPDRALRRARRLRPDGAGHGRLHGPHRHAGRRADARRRAGRRHLHRRLFGGRHPRRARTSASAPAAAAWSTPRWSISQVGVLANQALNYLVSGKVPKRIGNAHPNIVPYQVFPVADGHIIIATGNDSQFGKLCARAGRARARRAGRAIATTPTGSTHRDELVAQLSALTRAHDARRPAGEARSRAASRPGRSTISIRCSPIRRWSIAACGSTCRARRPRPAPSRACARRSWST